MKAAWLKGSSYLTERRSSRKLGSELERALSGGIPYQCTDGRILPGGVFWDGTAHRLNLLERVYQRPEVVYQA